MLNHKYTTGLTMFSLSHLITMLILVLITIGVIYLARNIKEDSKEDKIARYIFAGILIVLEIGYYYYFLVVEKYYELDMIPFTVFYATTSLITIYYLLANNKKVANIVFYYALTGSTLAIIFVTITNVFPHFRFIQYFGTHYIFMLVVIYNFVIGRVTIERKSFNRSTMYLVIYSVFILTINTVLKQNFFYFSESPLKPISDFLGPIFYPIGWMLAIYLLLNIWYFLFKYISKTSFFESRRVIQNLVPIEQ